jgi:PTH1 family peptidyl-tRNA hydrolase
MKLVVGLGNPGRKYEQTRHNIGFDSVRALAARHGAPPARARFEGLVQECSIAGEQTLLLMPQTYMNLSGRCVRLAVDFYKLPADALLMVCDDFNLNLGVLRLRASGSDGGQKGLADTIRQLGTDDIARLRLGIGPVPERWQAEDFVLGKFDPGEREQVDRQIRRSTEAVETWIAHGIQRAMNEYNGTDIPQES